MKNNTLDWDINETKKKVFIEKLAPIVLFTYNRLDHTKQTIEALKKNVYATQSHLFIYSDAPKNKDMEKEVNAVRTYVATIDGFKSIKIIERQNNLGLAKNIIDGVTKIINEYGKIIVLEDDIVTSKYFLKYMNDALEVYKNEDRVMEISGYMYPVDKKNLSTAETFFLRVPDCWGWGTWKSAWEYFERNPSKLKGEFTKKDIYEFNFENSENFWKQVVDNVNHKIYTWAIFWNATVFKKKGLSLYPRCSMTKNIGMDCTGVNCKENSDYDVELADYPVTRFEFKIEENRKNFIAVKNFFLSLKVTLWKRIVSKLKKTFKLLQD